MQLLDLEGSLNGSDTVGGVFSLPAIYQNDCFHCQTCIALDAQVSSGNYGSTFLGSITALTNSASHCETCRSMSSFVQSEQSTTIIYMSQYIIMNDSLVFQ